MRTNTRNSAFPRALLSDSVYSTDCIVQPTVPFVALIVTCQLSRDPLLKEHRETPGEVITELSCTLRANVIHVELYLFHYFSAYTNTEWMCVT